MSLNNTYFENKGRDITYPIPETPSYVPPDVPVPGTPVPGSEPVIPRPAFTSNIELDLYHNSSDNRKINKSLSNKKVINISLKETTNLLNPSLLLESDTDLTQYNYGYLKELGRYYYINAKRLDNNKHYILDMNQDHLMTYKSSILRLVCIIDKQEEIFNDLIDDGSYVSQVNDYTNRYMFGNGTSGFSMQPCNILICAGGAGTDGHGEFAGGGVSTVNSSNISIMASQSYTEQDDVIYVTPTIDPGYAVDTVTVHVDIPGGSTFDITDTLDYYGQYNYICNSDNPITITVTQKAI